MALADLQDINLHLPDDKIEVDDARYAPLQLDAERIVRGYLSGFFTPATLASWTDPDSTPGLIRAIVGRLVAAFYYRDRYSEDSLTDPQFAQNKYNEAIGWLNQIIAGTMVLDEVTDLPTDVLTALDFWPNDSTPKAKFAMEQIL